MPPIPVQLSTGLGRIPPIWTLNCTEARNKSEQDQLDSEAHKEFLRANKLKILSTKEKIQTMPLFKIADTRKSKMANKMGKFVIQLYNDVKNFIRFSQLFWPSRAFASNIVHQIDSNLVLSHIMHLSLIFNTLHRFNTLQ